MSASYLCRALTFAVTLVLPRFRGQVRKECIKGIIHSQGSGLVGIYTVFLEIGSSSMIIRFELSPTLIRPGIPFFLASVCNRKLQHARCCFIEDGNWLQNQIQQQGRYAWRVASGCTRQSLAENAVFRFKSIFGSRLRARRFDNQRVEGWIKCGVLNRMVSLGMPVSERIY